MAVTVAQLAVHLRIQDADTPVAEPYTTILSELLAWADEEVGSRTRAGTPQVARDRAVIALCAYLFDFQPGAARTAATANAWANSGAAHVLRRWTVRRGIALSPAVGAAGGSAGTGTPSVDAAEVRRIVDSIIMPRSAFAYYTAPPVPDIADVATQAVSDTGDPYVTVLVADFDAPAGIVAGVDFITEWEGYFEFELKTGGNLQIALRTTHEFSGKTLVHRRTIFEDGPGSVRRTIPMNVFNSRSRVVAGTFGGVTVTAEDIAQPSVISYALEFTVNTRKTETRKAGELSYLAFRQVQTVSYQLRQALVQQVGGGGGTGGGVDLAEVRSLIAAALAAYVTDAELMLTLQSLTARLLPTGQANGQFLGVVGGDPAWVAAPQGGGAPADGSIVLAMLAAAVAARLLPTGQKAGQLLGVSEGDPAWITPEDFDGRFESHELQIEALERKTADLIVGTVPESGWQNAASAAAGAVAVHSATRWNFAQAKATTWSQSIANPSGHFAVRVPNGTDMRQVRVRLTETGSDSNEFDIQGTALTRIVESPTDPDFDYYYYYEGPLSNVAAIVIQLTSSAAHVGRSRFLGQYAGGNLGLADFNALFASLYLLPVPFGANGTFLGIKGGKTEWSKPTATVSPSDIGTKTWSKAEAIQVTTFIDTGITVNPGDQSIVLIHLKDWKADTYNREGVFMSTRTWDLSQQLMIPSADFGNIARRAVGDSVVANDVNTRGVDFDLQIFRANFDFALTATTNRLLIAMNPGAVDYRQYGTLVVRGF